MATLTDRPDITMDVFSNKAHCWKTVLQCAQNFVIVLIICILVLTFLEPLIHDSKYGDKR